MKRKDFIGSILASATVGGLTLHGGAKTSSGIGEPEKKDGDKYIEKRTKCSDVYFTREIASGKVVELYNKTGLELFGKVAVKIHSGEPGGHNFLQPDFIAPILKRLKGTIVECNTAYEGRCNTTEKHLQTMKEHGVTAVGKVDIMDSEGEIALPVPNGKQIKVNYVGSHLADYDSLLVLSHFKGHLMGGFGGALKNMSIGIASAHGKAYIHGAGDESRLWSCPQNMFLESMADADKSVMEYRKNAIVFINVMSRLSVDCDCDSHPHDPVMADIGILSSLDPVALDKACVDLVYGSPDKEKSALIERMVSRNGTHILEAAEKLGVGTQRYRLIEI